VKKKVLVLAGSGAALVLGIGAFHWKDLAARSCAWRLVGNPALQDSWLELPGDSIKGRAVCQYFRGRPAAAIEKLFQTLEANLHPRDPHWKDSRIVQRGTFGIMPGGAAYWYDRIDGSGGASEGVIYGQEYDAKDRSLHNVFEALSGHTVSVPERPGWELTFFCGKEDHLLGRDGFGVKAESLGEAARERVNLGPAIWTGKELVVLGAPHGAAYDPGTGRWRTIAGIPHPTNDIAHDPCAVWIPDGRIVCAWGSKPQAVSFDVYETESDTWKTVGESAQVFDDPVERFSDCYLGVVGGALLEERQAVLFVQWGGKAGASGPLRGFLVPAVGGLRPIRASRDAPELFFWKKPAIHSFGNKVFVWGFGNSGRNVGGIWDAESDTWRKLPDDPMSSRPRCDFGHCRVGDRVIVFGGYYGSSGTELIDDGLIYSFREDRWRPLTISPRLPGRRSFSMTAIDDEVLLWRGGLEDRPVGEDKLEVILNPTTGSWRPLPVEGGPGPRIDPLCGWTGKEVLVVGGYIHPRFYLDAWAFLPSMRSWQSLGPVPRLRRE
jgi:Kelch motif